MNKFIISMLFALLMVTSYAQEAEIKARVDKMFQAMYDGDTAALRKCFIPAAQLMTFAHDAHGNPRAKAETIGDFIRGVALIGEDEFEERLTGWQCLIDDGIASVWTPYEFYFEGEFSHCGVNSFQLIKVQGDWKIAMITDTRRKTNCRDDKHEVMIIDSIMNEWHHAAAVADEVGFFGRMTDDGIYIGTDPTERWLRDELALWAKKYFERESAWKFTPLSRNIKMGPGGQIAWIDELLDTWMGTCRSTGILILKDKEWKIIHYHLSIAVPNDKVDAYKVLIGLK